MSLGLFCALKVFYVKWTNEFRKNSISLCKWVEFWKLSGFEICSCPNSSSLWLYVMQDVKFLWTWIDWIEMLSKFLWVVDLLNVIMWWFFFATCIIWSKQKESVWFSTIWWSPKVSYWLLIQNFPWQAWLLSKTHLLAVIHENHDCEKSHYWLAFLYSID